MPRTHRRGKARQTDLTYDEWEYLSFGPQKGSPFASPFLARAAWLLHRDELMVCNPGHRSYGWWLFEAEEPRRDGESQPDYLLRLGLMDSPEKALVLAHKAILEGGSSDD